MSDEKLRRIENLTLYRPNATIMPCQGGLRQSCHGLYKFSSTISFLFFFLLFFFNNVAYTLKSLKLSTLPCPADLPARQKHTRSPRAKDRHLVSRNSALEAHISSHERAPGSQAMFRLHVTQMHSLYTSGGGVKLSLGARSFSARNTFIGISRKFHN